MPDNDLEPQNKQYSLPLILIFAGLSLFVIFVVGVYIKNFGTSLSVSQSTWGAFGDYVGGILNPVFAFVSFMALLYTIIIQSMELRLTRGEMVQSRQIAADHKNLAKKQGHKDDIYRMIVEADKGVDILLEQPANICGKRRPFPGDTDRFLKEFFGRNANDNFTDDIPVFVSGTGNNNPLIVRYVRAIAELYNYLDQFENEAGNAVVTDYYKRRHVFGVNTLYITNYVGEQINNYFKSGQDLDGLLEHDQHRQE